MGVASSLLWEKLPPSGWLLDLVAGTNPSRPVLTFPELVQNFIELPRLLYDTFRFLSNPKSILPPKGLASAHLAVRFGWMPFIDDLRKLLDLQTHVMKRMKEINQLHSGRGLRRRLKFETETRVEKVPTLVAVTGTSSYLSSDCSVTIRKETWGTIRWRPTAPMPFHPSDPKWNQRVKKIVLGLTPDAMAYGLWKVIPWTWLLGWFTNVGKLLMANSNAVPARWANANFMSKVTATRTAGPAVIPLSWFGNAALTGQNVYTLRTRTSSGGVPLPGFSIPFMDMGRLSVLASLAVQRLR